MASLFLLERPLACPLVPFVPLAPFEPFACPLTELEFGEEARKERESCIMTWALDPPYPKLLMDARRMPSRSGHGSSSVGTCHVVAKLDQFFCNSTGRSLQ